MARMVSNILDDKGRVVLSVEPETSVYAALEKMAEHDVGALVVMKDGGLVGIVSERDYARKVVLHGHASKDMPVSEIMTSDVVTVASNDSVQSCMAIVTERRIRHLPVVDDGDLVGVISIGDVVKAVISDQEFLIKELEKYITG